MSIIQKFMFFSMKLLHLSLHLELLKPSSVKTQNFIFTYFMCLIALPGKAGWYYDRDRRPGVHGTGWNPKCVSFKYAHLSTSK